MTKPDVILKQYLQQPEFTEPTLAAQKELDKYPIVVHSQAAEGVNKSLVLLVHGLTGHRYKGYWDQMPAFLLEDFPKSDIGLYYHKTGWRRRSLRSIRLDEEAVILADALTLLHTYETIILVCHSMGGLLAKGAIAYLLENDRTELLRKIAGLLLLASPQLGSLSVPSILRSFSHDAQALYPHNDYIEKIDRLYRQQVKTSASSYSAKKTVILTWALLAAEDSWVDRLSAGIDIPDKQKCVFREDHGSIVSPKTKEQPAYKYLRDCVSTCVKGAEGSPEFDEKLVCEHPLDRDASAIHKLACRFFGDQVTPEEIIASFIQQRRDIFRVVRRIAGSGSSEDHYEVLEGYFCVLPLSTDAAQTLKDGRLTGDHIELTHLAPEGNVPAAIFVGAIAGKDFWSRGFVEYALLKHLERLSHGGSVEILARPKTRDGERLAKQRGLQAKYKFEGRKTLLAGVVKFPVES